MILTRKLYTVGCLIVATLAGVLAGCQPATSEPDPLTFTDVAQEVGLDFTQGAFRWGTSGDPIAMMGGGVCWIDYDNDGWLDLYAVNSYATEEAGRWEQEEGELPTSALFRNDEGTFTDVSSEAGMDVAMRGNGCVAADFNLDGYSDLYVTTSRVNLLFWNNGDGTFEEGAVAAGVDAYGWQTATSVGDLNQDGWPDLFVAGYVDINNRIPEATMGFPNTNLGLRDLLYLSEGADADGKIAFREVGEMVGLEAEPFEYGLGALLSDFDTDGDLDLFVANDTNPNRLYENIPLDDDPEGIGFRFEEIGQGAQVDDQNSGMGVAGGDYNDDGKIDIVITNMGEQFHSLYANEASTDVLAFADTASDIGVEGFGVGWTGWGISWGDFDLDTDVDLSITNGGIPVLDIEEDAMALQIYINQSAQGEAGTLADYSDLGGSVDIGPLVGRGSAIGDYDNDGDLDIVINSIGSDLVLLENQNEGGNWLSVDVGEFSPGTIVTVTLPNGTQMSREIHAGSSYLSSEDDRCHFGLGGARRVAEVSVQWADGTETTLENVSANQILTITE